MERSLEQRYAIKFWGRLGKTASETLTLLQQAFKEDVLSRAQVFRWHKDFLEGREAVDDVQRSGRPTSIAVDATVAKVKGLLDQDRRLSVREVAQELDLCKSTVHTIVTTNLAMRKVCARLVPKVLSDEQKERRVQASRDMLERVESDPNILDYVVTGDESWVYQYDPETKRQSEEWHTSASPRPKKARMSKSKVKTMILAFFDNVGMVHWEFLPPGKTLTGAYYKQVLIRLNRNVKRRRPVIATS